MSTAGLSARTIRCPNCEGPSRYAADNPFRPFCSQRCKDHDLGAWASEGYAVPADPERRDVDPDLGDTLPH